MHSWGLLPTALSFPFTFLALETPLPEILRLQLKLASTVLIAWIYVFFCSVCGEKNQPIFVDKCGDVV